jgi:hypothetical protein
MTVIPLLGQYMGAVATALSLVDTLRRSRTLHTNVTMLALGHRASRIMRRNLILIRRLICLTGLTRMAGFCHSPTMIRWQVGLSSS